MTAAATGILITYTTEYRDGGREMAAAARHLAAQKQAQSPGSPVYLCRVESKAAFLEAIAQAGAAARLQELHFIGHSGLYGPMFGSRHHPEQMSRFEWGQLEIPFAPDAEAFVCPVAPTVAPFVGNSVSELELVTPLAPPTAVCVTVPPEVAIKPPPPPPPGPSASALVIGCVPPTPPLA